LQEEEEEEETATSSDPIVLRLCSFNGLHIITKPANSRLAKRERGKHGE
jgi:hypothetical protein